MSKRRYHVEVTVTAVLEVDDEVVESVDEEWLETFYPLASEHEVAEHLAYNLLKGEDLSTIDGFAQFKDDQAVLKDVEHVDWIVVPLGAPPVRKLRAPKRKQQVNR